jgi:hypothetical protein
MTSVLKDKHDPQVRRVYSWEANCLERHLKPQVLSKDEVNRLIRDCARSVKRAPPTVTWTSLPVNCLAIPSRNELRIADWGRTVLTVAHEMAHIGSWGQVLQGAEPHGPEFVGVAMDLYEEFCGFDRDYLHDTARRYEVRFESKSPPPMLGEGLFDF